MNGLEAYSTYLAVRNHFKTDYDYFKYNGKIKVNEDKFRTRRDHYQFEKMARIYNKRPLHKVSGVYFIEDAGGVKIGHATDIETRITDLQTGNSTILKVLGVIRCKGRDMLKEEKMAHTYFQK